MNRTLPAFALVALAAVLAIAGCGSSNSSSSSGEGGVYGSGGESAASTQGTTGSSAGGRYGATGSTSTGAGAGAAVVSVGKASGVGQVLVDSNGMTLYYFEKDPQGGGKSACNGACASAWPPMTASGTAKATGGAMASKLGTIERSDGTTQVTYAGWPLYTYTADTAAGEANGTDVKAFGGSWYPLHANGEKAGS